MNKLKETTNELLEAGYTIEEIKAAFEEVLTKIKKSNKQNETDN